jgi:hypothetical protein
LLLPRIEPRFVASPSKIKKFLRGRNSKPGSREYEAGVLITQPLRSMSSHVLTDPTAVLTEKSAIMHFTFLFEGSICQIRCKYLVNRMDQVELIPRKGEL